MINVFITVGTTPFDKLIKLFDENIDLAIFNCSAQVSDLSEYSAKRIRVVPFVEDIKKYLLDSDIIISHAGAGNVYNILELNKKGVFVPNDKLKDSHQNDICKFLKIGNFAEVYCLDSELEINQLLFKVFNSSYNKYGNINKMELIKSIYTDLKFI
jgi:beta-1,4-N-acetylglucosaminyltransferase